MDQRRVITIFGKQPAAIKMAPILLELGRHANVSTCVVVTSHHTTMLDQVLREVDSHDG